MKRLLFAMAFGFGLAGPLQGQPVAPPLNPSLDCPLEGVSAEQRTLAAAASSQQLTDAPTDGEQRGRAALDAVLANLPRCAESARWTENQRNLAHQYVLMRLAREDMLRRYAAQNVDLGFIDQAVTATPAGSPPPFDDLVARVRAQGVGEDRPDSAGDIVYIYMTLVYHVAEIRAGFADPNFQLR
jgi:hypothetical protein